MNGNGGGRAVTHSEEVRVEGGGGRMRNLP